MKLRFLAFVTVGFLLAASPSKRAVDPFEFSSSEGRTIVRTHGLKFEINASRIHVQGPGFEGDADEVKYNSATKLLTLEATKRPTARLLREVEGNTAKEVIEGRKIYFWLETGDFKITQ